MSVRWITTRALTHLFLFTLALLYALPILFMLASSFKPDDRVLAEAGTWLALVPLGGSLENYADVLERTNFLLALANSMLITSGIVAGGLVVNSLAGYALARLEWPGRKAVLLLVTALLTIPFEAVAVPLFYQVSVIGWRDSYQVQIIPFVADAFAIYLFYSFFLDLPRSLEEAAQIDGAGPWRTFFSIIVPASRPVFATVAVLTFVIRWGSYLWPLMVTVGERYRPLPVSLGVFENQVKAWGDIMAFGVMMVVPVVLVFLACQDLLERGLAASGSGRKG